MVVLIGLLLPTCALGQKDTTSIDTSTYRSDYFVSLSGFVQRGVFSSTIIPGKASYTLGNDKIQGILAGTYMYGKFAGTVSQNDLISRAVCYLKPGNRLFAGIGYNFEFSTMYHVAYRSAPGIGIGYRILKKPRSEMVTHIFSSYEVTEFVHVPGYSTIRANAILFGEHELIKGLLQFNYQLFFYQSLDNAINYRFRAHPQLAIHITKILDFTISYDYHYETVVDPNNTRENYFVTFGLKLTKPQSNIEEKPHYQVD